MECTGCFVGIDWGETQHSVALFTPGTEAMECFDVAHSPAGLNTLSEKLRAAGRIQGVVVEGLPVLLVNLLIDNGYTIYCINPKRSAAWREAESVAGAKSDRADAQLLARQLSVQHERLRPEHREGESIQMLGALCEDEQRLIKRRTALVQEVEAVLKSYYPAALEFFTDWTAPSAWNFVLRFPTPHALAHASKKRVCAFLAVHRIGMSPLWQQRVENRTHAVDWPSAGAAESAYCLRACSLARELNVVEKNLRDYREQIETLYEQQPDAALFRSLPGAGPKLAPRLMAMLGEDRDHYEAADDIQKLGGVVPVTVQSGISRKVHIRRACKKLWRDTLHNFARTSQFRCAWARAFYRQCREKGDNDATALRKLAEKWLKIIFRMWKDKKPYDETRYINALTKHGSPLIALKSRVNFRRKETTRLQADDICSPN